MKPATTAGQGIDFELARQIQGRSGARGSIGGFWSAQRIRTQHAITGIFWEPEVDSDRDPDGYELDDGRLKAASYNIKMGPEAYVTPVSDTDPKSIRKLKPGEAFRIPPGQFAFLLTHEAVIMPSKG